MIIYVIKGTSTQISTNSYINYDQIIGTDIYNNPIKSDIVYPTSTFPLYSDEELSAIGIERQTVDDPIPPVPNVTRAQARLALSENSTGNPPVMLWDQVTAAVTAMNYLPATIWFEEALYWEYNNSYVQAIAVELGLDDAFVRNLFITYSTRI